MTVVFKKETSPSSETNVSYWVSRNIKCHFIFHVTIVSVRLARSYPKKIKEKNKRRERERKGSMND